MRRKFRLTRTLVPVVAVALMSTGLVACATSTPTTEIAANRETVIVEVTSEVVVTSVVEVTPEALEPIIIGMAAPFTGAIAYIGEDINRGLTMAAEELNAAGGILGHPVQIIACDEEVSVEKAVSCLRRMAELDNVHVIAGMGFSGAVLASMPLLEEYGVPNIETLASAAQITADTGPAGGNTWLFRAGPHDGMMAAALADFIAANAGKVSFLIANTEQGRSIAGEMQTLLEAEGVEILGIEYFEQGQPDFRPVSTKIKGQDPEALFLVAEASDGSVLLRQFKELGMSMPIYERGSVTSPEFLEFTLDDPSLGEGIMGAVQLSPLLDPDYGERYLTRWGGPTRFHGIGAYVAARYIIPAAVEMAILETGEATRASIRDALEKISMDVPMMGFVEFDEYNQAHPPVHIHQIQDGELVHFAEVPTE